MQFLITANRFLWGGPLLFLLLGLHLYYTWRLKFVQRKIGTAIRLSLEEPDSNPQNSASKKSGFCRFGSLTTTLAATLGTGNIVGVSTAVFLGGPGAVFWCWLTGALGMATTYAETWLCCKHRFKDSEGHLCSGPMYILHYILNKKWLALIYSAALCFSAFFIGCTTQSNALSYTCKQTFGTPLVISSLLAALFTGFVIIRGRSLIERISIALVPAMALFFVGSCLLYLILHASYIFPAIREILYAAFHASRIADPSLNPVPAVSSAVSGVTGFAIGKAVRYGIARGLFTNEAGLGTSGLIAGSSTEENPHHQALVSMSASFWDTVVLCAITGIVLVSFQLEYPGEWQQWSSGALLSGAFSKLPFFGTQILAASIVCFAFATLVGWSYIGIRGYIFLFHGKYLPLYRIIYLVMIFTGGILPLNLVWEITDLVNLFLLIPSVYLLIKCHKEFM